MPKQDYLPRSSDNKTAKITLHQETWDMLDMVCDTSLHSNGTDTLRPTRNTMITSLIKYAYSMKRKDMSDSFNNTNKE